MSLLLQEFESQISDGSGRRYRVLLYGQSRPRNTWEGWLVFERLRDGARFSTPVETTQSTSQGILYWATGLTDAYFEGALRRAFDHSDRKVRRTSQVRQPEPLVRSGDDSAIRRRKLSSLETSILDFVRRQRSPRVLAQKLFDALPHANADIVRALEDLEKRQRLLVRQTEDGSDWIVLTEAGLRVTDLTEVPHVHDKQKIDPPKATG